MFRDVEIMQRGTFVATATTLLERLSKGGSAWLAVRNRSELTKRTCKFQVELRKFDQRYKRATRTSNRLAYTGHHDNCGVNIGF
jgi:hypothetical protein